VEGEAAKCWIAVNRASKCRVTELNDMTRECGNYVQVVEVVLLGGSPIVIANVYDRHTKGDKPAHRAYWRDIAKSKGVIIAGDMNAHSTVWNPRATRGGNAVFWERLIEDEALFVWNTDEATRTGPGAYNHSIIDLTLSSPNIDLAWTILGHQATGSDHELIAWEGLGREALGVETSKESTG